LLWLRLEKYDAYHFFDNVIYYLSYKRYDNRTS